MPFYVFFSFCIFCFKCRAIEESLGIIPGGHTETFKNGNLLERRGHTEAFKNGYLLERRGHTETFKNGKFILKGFR